MTRGETLFFYSGNPPEVQPRELSPLYFYCNVTWNNLLYHSLLLGRVQLEHLGKNLLIFTGRPRTPGWSWWRRPGGRPTPPGRWGRWRREAGPSQWSPCPWWEEERGQYLGRMYILQLQIRMEDWLWSKIMSEIQILLTLFYVIKTQLRRRGYFPCLSLCLYGIIGLKYIKCP